MKLNELFEAQYKQWKHGDVVLDRAGKVHIVDQHKDDVKVYMKHPVKYVPGVASHFHPNNLTAADPEIVDAAKSVGTTDELPAVYHDVIKYMPKVKSMSEGDLKALLDRSKGQAKFAVRVAMKAAGVREPN